MILQALYQYYGTLVEKGVLSSPGWDSGFKVSFALELDDEGQLINVIDLRTEQTQGKKTVIVPRLMNVPAHRHTNSVTPNFLCDNSTYLLGVDENNKPEWTQERFQSCIELHRKVLEGVDTPTTRAILGFFDSWDPAAAPSHPLLAPRWSELTGSANLIFSHRALLVTEDAAIWEAWQRWYDAVDPEAYHGQCLITGKEGCIEKTHPQLNFLEQK